MGTNGKKRTPVPPSASASTSTRLEGVRAALFQSTAAAPLLRRRMVHPCPRLSYGDGTTHVSVAVPPPLSHPLRRLRSRYRLVQSAAASLRRCTTLPPRKYARKGQGGVNTRRLPLLLPLCTRATCAFRCRLWVFAAVAGYHKPEFGSAVPRASRPWTITACCANLQPRPVTTPTPQFPPVFSQPRPVTTPTPQFPPVFSQPRPVTTPTPQMPSKHSQTASYPSELH